MARRHIDASPPRWALIAGGVMIAISLTLAFIGSATGIGTTGVVTEGREATRDLKFLDAADGGIVVEDATTGHTVAVLPSGTNGFVRVVMRGLARHRKVAGLGPDHPFRLTQWASGHLSIEDEQTGRKIHLNAFGEPNRQAFARLLEEQEVTR